MMTDQLVWVSARARDRSGVDAWVAEATFAGLGKAPRCVEYRIRALDPAGHKDGIPLYALKQCSQAALFELAHGAAQ